MNELVEPLVDLLRRGADNPAAGQALNALAAISYKREHFKRAIVKAGAIPDIVQLVAVRKRFGLAAR